MSVIYRTSGPWGAGKGSDLAPSEVDSNFYQLVQSVAAKAAQGVGISHFVVTGNQMTVVLTDATMVGPYTLPVAQISFRGDWAPATQYYANQIFTHGGSTYIVLVNHISASSFDPAASDGLGNAYYGLLLSNPSATLPTGGAVGSVLTKLSATDYSVWWVLPTLAGLTDVLASPGPVSGQLVYWNGSAFSYISQASVLGAPPNLAELSDVLHSPGPTTGQLVYWNGSKFSYLSQSAIVPGPAPMAFADLTDVLASPAPVYGQVVYWNGSYFTYATLTTSLLTDWHLSGLSQWDVMEYDAANVRWSNRQPLVYTNGWSGSFTLTLTHAQNLVDINPGGTITVPSNSSIAFAKGAAIWFRMNGSVASPFAFTPASGVTLNIPAGRIAQPRALGSIVMLQQTSTFDTWVVSGDLAYATPPAMPTTGNFSVDPRLNDCDVFSWVPAGNQTASVTSGAAQIGKRMTFVITTSGTSSFTLTFGTGFKSQGTLATGTVTAKVFTITFIGDGTNFNEVSRTTAM